MLWHKPSEAPIPHENNKPLLVIFRNKSMKLIVYLDEEEAFLPDNGEPINEDRIIAWAEGVEPPTPDFFDDTDSSIQIPPLIFFDGPPPDHAPGHYLVQGQPLASNYPFWMEVKWTAKSGWRCVTSGYEFDSNLTKILRHMKLSD